MTINTVHSFPQHAHRFPPVAPLLPPGLDRLGAKTDDIAAGLALTSLSSFIGDLIAPPPPTSSVLLCCRVGVGLAPPIVPPSVVLECRAGFVVSGSFMSSLEVFPLEGCGGEACVRARLA